MSEKHTRRDNQGRFMTERAYTGDPLPITDDNTIGKITKAQLSDSVDLHPVQVDVLKKTVEEAADGDDFVMLATPTQDLENGARTCMIVAANENEYWDVMKDDARKSVYVAGGATYEYTGDDE